jgi:hypothetical protein
VLPGADHLCNGDGRSMVPVYKKLGQTTEYGYDQGNNAAGNTDLGWPAAVSDPVNDLSNMDRGSVDFYCLIVLARRI